MSDIEKLREALSKIAEIASQAANATSDGDGFVEGSEDGDYAAPTPDQAVCTPKSLPRALLIEAANKAIEINPVNAPAFGPVNEIVPGVSGPLQIAVLTAKYWGPQARRLTVSFMESAPANLRKRILEHMNAWSRSCGITFVETRSGGQVRISRGGDGYWSYLGTDVLLIPRNRQTMNLQGFTMNTPESEYKRVIRHEVGHTLGFPHEHMRKELVALIDPQKAYEYFLRTQGWDQATVDQQVLTPLDQRSIIGTPPDQTSIMCYQLPGSITKSGRPISGGTDINATDAAFAARIYPKPGSAPLSPEDAFAEEDALAAAATAGYRAPRLLG